MEKKNISKMKNSVTLEIIVIIQGEYKGAAYSICKLKCRVPNKVPIAFYSGSKCDYHFTKNIFCSPLSNFVNNHSKGIHKIKFKF